MSDDRAPGRPLDLPDEVDLGPIRLRRHRVDDAALLADAVARNREHLIPWMPWAADEAGGTVEFQRARLEAATGAWAAGDELVYLVIDATTDALAGAIGLHRRIGPGALEIGYWLDRQHVGRGVMTTAAAAVSDLALGLDGVARVEIRCDEANVRSAAIPARLGFRLDRIEDDGVAAPGEVGRGMVWVKERGAPR